MDFCTLVTTTTLLGCLACHPSPDGTARLCEPAASNSCNTEAATYQCIKATGETYTLPYPEKK